MISLLGRGAHRRNGHSLVWVSTLFLFIFDRILIMPSIIPGITIWLSYLSHREHRHDIMYRYM